MPPAVAQNNNASTRRSTGSTRQRENRLHAQSGQAGTGSARRRKSRSPEARVAEEAQVQADVLARRKKRLPPIPGASSSNSLTAATLRHTVYEHVGDRGRTKPKPKPRAVTMFIDEDEDVTPIITNIVQDRPRLSNVQRSKRKDRSRSRETAHRHSRKTGTPEPLEDEEEHAYTGPLAHAEFTRMKLEMENLRKVRDFCTSQSGAAVERKLAANGDGQEDDHEAEQGLSSRRVSFARSPPHPSRR